MDIDSGNPRRLFIGADRVNITAELGPLQNNEEEQIADNRDQDDIVDAQTARQSEALELSQGVRAGPLVISHKVGQTPIDIHGAHGTDDGSHPSIGDN